MLALPVELVPVAEPAVFPAVTPPLPLDMAEAFPPGVVKMLKNPPKEPVLENPPTVVDPVLEKPAVPSAVPLVPATPLPVAVPLPLFWANATPEQRTKRPNATAGVIPCDIVVPLFILPCWTDGAPKRHRKMSRATKRFQMVTFGGHAAYRTESHLPTPGIEPGNGGYEGTPHDASCQ